MEHESIQDDFNSFEFLKTITMQLAVSIHLESKWKLFDASQPEEISIYLSEWSISFGIRLEISLCSLFQYVTFIYVYFFSKWKEIYNKAHYGIRLRFLPNFPY